MLTKRNISFEAAGRSWTAVVTEGLRATLSWIDIDNDAFPVPFSPDDPREQRRALLRAVNAARPVAVAAMIAAGKREQKVSWSAKRICRCGCSPSFIVEDPTGWAVSVKEAKA